MESPEKYTEQGILDRLRHIPRTLTKCIYQDYSWRGCGRRTDRGGCWRRRCGRYSSAGRGRRIELRILVYVCSGLAPEAHVRYAGVRDDRLSTGVDDYVLGGGIRKGPVRKVLLRSVVDGMAFFEASEIAIGHHLWCIRVLRGG